jgi:integrase/recombinase XerD
MKSIQNYPSPVTRIRSDVKSNDDILRLWLHGKSPHTQEFYSRIALELITAIDKPLQWLTLEDLQTFADHLESQGLAKSSQRTYLSAVKSLLSFASKTGLIHFNVGAAVKCPMAKDSLSEKILDRDMVLKMIDHEPILRNQLILKLFYYVGLRVSELINLTWSDLNGEYLTIYGKGGKTRVVRVPELLVRELVNFKGDVSYNEPIFVSHKTKKALRRESVTHLVKEAAVRVGASSKTSSHWLRHCHATHSLSKGAPINLVSQTLGHSSVAITSKYLHCRPDLSSGQFL